MGFKIGWIAVKNTSMEKLQSFYGLSKTDKKEEFPDFDINYCKIDDSWSLLFFNEFLSKNLEDNILCKLSGIGEVICCQVHEGIMVSMLSFFESGIKQWSIVHDSSQGTRHLFTEGSIPNEVLKIMSRIKQEREKEQNEEDKNNNVWGVDYYFDIPVDIAYEMVNFRYNLMNDKIYYELVNLKLQSSSLGIYGFGSRLQDTSDTAATTGYRLNTLSGTAVRFEVLSSIQDGKRVK